MFKGGLQVWNVDANTLNTKPMAATWRSSGLEVGGEKQTVAVTNGYKGKSARQLWKPLLCEVSIKYWRDHSPLVFLKTITQGLEWQKKHCNNYYSLSTIVKKKNTVTLKPTVWCYVAIPWLSI